MSITVTNAPFVPATTQIGNSETGTISNISCAGPCTATIYSAAGVALKSISSVRGVNEVVSISFTGVPTIVQTTSGAIYITT